MTAPVIEALLQRATALSRSLPQEGLALTESVLQQIREQGLVELELEALTIRAGILHEVGSPEASLEALQQALHLLPQCDDLSRRTRFYTVRGWLAFLRGELGEALSHTRTALEIGGPNLNTACWASNNLGLIYRALGAREQALHYFLQARKQSQALGLTLTEGAALINISLLHADQSDFTAAFETIHEAIPLIDHSPDEYAKAAAHGHLMDTLIGLGRYDEAELVCQELLKHRQATSLSQVIGQVYQGRIARLRGEYTLAQRFLRQALRAAQQGQLMENLVQIQQEQALLLESQGKRAAAARLLRNALHQARHIGLRTEEAALLELAARIAEHRKLYRQALEYVREYQAIERERTRQEASNQRILFTIELELEKARQETATERARSARLKEEAARDGMTGLYNHATFQRVLHERIAQEPLAVILLDVDNFKHYNDAFGHPAGDTLLKQLATLLSQQLRAEDFLARYGGEEFALIISCQQQSIPREIAERLREAVEEQAFDHTRVTISVGLASTPLHTLCPQKVIEAADRALYQAKLSGKNRVIVAQ